jgi:hypothetical protein
MDNQLGFTIISIKQETFYLLLIRYDLLLLTTIKINNLINKIFSY